MVPKLASVMTPFPYSIAIGASVEEAKKLMKKHHIRHLPVTKKEQVIGILSERDIYLTKAIIAQFADDVDIKVSEAFVPKPYKVELDEPLEVVLREMAERHIGSAIVTKKGKLAGIFTSTDACLAYANHIAAARGDFSSAPELA